jgi:hypothetical protein
MLSDEEKRRIEEEEAYRAEVRARLESEQEEEEEAPRKRKPLGCGSLVAVGFAVFVFYLVSVGVQSSGSGSGSGSSATTRQVITMPSGRTLDQYDAQILCEGRVRDRLVSPGSARFAGRSDSAWTNPRLSGNTWRHRVVVDSQNSFGALLRSEWDCVLDGTNDTINVTQR